MQVYSLSKKLSRGGIASLRPLRFLASMTIPDGLEAGSNGSPGNTCQWSKTHCGNAWPLVLARRSAVKPAEQTMSHYISFSGKCTVNLSLGSSAQHPDLVYTYPNGMLLLCIFFKFKVQCPEKGNNAVLYITFTNSNISF